MLFALVSMIPKYRGNEFYFIIIFLISSMCLLGSCRFSPSRYLYFPARYGGGEKCTMKDTGILGENGHELSNMFFCFG